MLLTKAQLLFYFSFQTNWKKFLVRDLPTQCGVFFTMSQFVSFLSFRSFSTGQICQRWHKDKVANRHCYRYFFSMCIAYKVIKHKGPFKYYVSKEVSAFYLEKQKSFNPKKEFLSHCQYQNKKALFTDSIF